MIYTIYIHVYTPPIHTYHILSIYARMHYMYALYNKPTILIIIYARIYAHTHIHVLIN